MKNSFEQIQTLQVLYEISMAIGTSLDLNKMLKVCLSTVLKKLNCAAGGVYSLPREGEVWSFQKAYSIPRDTGRNDTYQAALAQVRASVSRNETAGNEVPPGETPAAASPEKQWLEFRASLPRSEQRKPGHYYYIFDLPDFGCLILVKYGQSLAPALVNSLQPMLLKLAAACRACLSEAALEASLERRARQVQTATEVAQEIALASDLDELFSKIVHLVKERFGYYYAHIYTLENEKLVMQQGTGQVGRKLKEAGHQLDLEAEKSLAAQVARQGKPALASDVTQRPGWVPTDRLLAATQSQLAVPIKLGNEVLGVLDVQSDKAAGMDEEDQLLLAGLCGQIAIFIHDYRLDVERKEVKLALQESEAHLQKIAENVPGMIYQFLLRADGVTAEFTYVSSGSRRVYGLEPEVIVRDASTILDIVHPAEIEAFYRSIEISAKTLQRWHWEGRVNLPSGQTKWLNAESAPHRLENGDTVWYGVVLDVTDRKQAEQLLAKRAVEFETVAQVSISTSTILDTNRLLQEMVDLTKERFDLYHVHIYLLNETGDSLDLAAGAGQAGRQMTAEGWSIPLDRQQSLVARAARFRQGVIVNDVRQDPNFLQNPLLPETRSELAVPLLVQDQLLGVLDVQSAVLDRFTEEDLNLHTILAAQVAATLRNTRLYSQMQERAERERLINLIGQKIQDTVTVESALQTAARELGQALRAGHTRVELAPLDRADQADVKATETNGAGQNE